MGLIFNFGVFRNYWTKEFGLQVVSSNIDLMFQKKRMQQQQRIGSTAAAEIIGCDSSGESTGQLGYWKSNGVVEYTRSLQTFFALSYQFLIFDSSQFWIQFCSWFGSVKVWLQWIDCITKIFPHMVVGD